MYKILEDNIQEKNIKSDDPKNKSQHLENVKDMSKRELVKLSLEQKKFKKKSDQKKLSKGVNDLINSLRKRKLETIEEELENEMDNVSQFDPKFVKNLKVELETKKEERKTEIKVEGQYVKKTDFRLKYADLLDETICLPLKFKKNLELLNCIDFLLRIIKIKKNFIFFSDLKRQIQSKLHRKVYLKNVQEVDAVGVQLFSFKRMKNERSGFNEIIVDFYHEDNEEEKVPTFAESLQRFKKCKQNYFTIVKKYHDEFLRDLEIDFYDLEKEKSWHHEFPLNEINYSINLTPLPRDNSKLHAESILEKYSHDLTNSRLSIKHEKLNLGENLTQYDKKIFARKNIISKLVDAGLLEHNKQVDNLNSQSVFSNENIDTKLKYIKNEETGKIMIDRDSLSRIGRERNHMIDDEKLKKIKKRILEEVMLKEKEDEALRKKALQQNLFGHFSIKQFQKMIFKINFYFKSRKVRAAFYVKLRDFLMRNANTDLNRYQMKGVIDTLVKHLPEWIEYKDLDKGLLVRIKRYYDYNYLMNKFIIEHKKLINK
jgi:hypothetical protein